MQEPDATLALWDYRRRVGELYREVRQGAGDEAAWRHWRVGRDDLFASHPQSPLPPERREGLEAIPFFEHDPTWVVDGRVEPLDDEVVPLEQSGGGRTVFRAFGRVRFELQGREHVLTLLWLDAYGGGVFLPFRDATNGSATYGGGRYLLDTAKGADLGGAGRMIGLDFNYAYHPSCVHDDRWSCPLAPPENRLDIEVRAGERLPA